MPVPSALKLSRHERGRHTTITLSGEIDLDTAGRVVASVEDSLRRGSRTISIDVSSLVFCDVSGLNAFLIAADRIAAVGGSLDLRGPCPMLGRLLELTDTDFLRAPSLTATAPGMSAF